MTTPRSSADRRHAREIAQDAILDVAERLAGVDGASSLSLKRLAEEAGVSTMVIYSRFGDRFGLEEALARRASDSLVQTIVAAGATGSTTITELGRAFWTWATEQSSRFSLLFLTSHLLDATLRPEIDDAIARAGQTIDRQLGWAEGSTEGGGLTVLAALVGYLTMELRQQLPRATSEQEYSELLVALGTLDPTS